MLDRKKLESSYRDSLGCEWLELTALEVSLIKLYRQLSEKDRKQVRRIAGYLVETANVD
ncbi:hypothetical protein PSH61_20590 [Pseudomonas rhodesiae]|jgi:hypothetical protein|uniref:hypothetical protein n=1 Tax=Pseudomonas rhodesiae TaxID=76760 RepID=UPI0027334B88|nr:hypothetical protein [Pseudomonas rhodesiae]WLI28199.1 hypothetical protein PSH61_20590 [Pseudomonas rhodesiae]